MRIMVFGASGMLGHQMVRVLSENPNLNVYGTLRSTKDERFKSFSDNISFIEGVDAECINVFEKKFIELAPDVVINCIGLVKQKTHAQQHSNMITLNSLFPHRLNELCEKVDAYLIHFSTDCVFSGTVGNYKEQDLPDAMDLYGRSKLLGEPISKRSISLRTSMIGHELTGKHGLLEWFLMQDKKCVGFKKAIFSGFSAVELAAIVRDYIINDQSLNGLYHVASSPLSKYDLLSLVATIYEKEIFITPEEETVVNRSLCGALFEQSTGFCPPSWSTLIRRMRDYG